MNCHKTLLRRVLPTLLLILSATSYAQIGDGQVRVAMENAVNKTVDDLRLSEDYAWVARKAIREILLSKEMTALILKISKESKIESQSYLEQVGANIMTTTREKAVLRLSRQDLYRLVILNSKVASVMNDYECAQFYRKRRTDETGKGRSIYKIAANLDLKSFEEYLNLFTKAFLLFTSEVDESEKFTKSEIDSIKEEYAEKFSDLIEKKPFIADFFQSGKTFAKASDSEVCRIGKSLSELVVSGDKWSAQRRNAAFVQGLLF